MNIVDAKIEYVKEVNPNIFRLKVYCPEIAKECKPGQFCNIKVSDTDFPLLRRPFSISDCDGDSIYFLFNLVGEGTRILSTKKEGDIINLLGPLGNSFNLEDDFDHAVFVAGGLGVAPFPFLSKYLTDKKITSIVGGRNKNDVVLDNLSNTLVATDDGSEGFTGNTVQLLESIWDDYKNKKVKIFSCGPTPMFKALQTFCSDKYVECEISSECAMACGFGICQGCPIEYKDGYYKLVCKDGPVFNVRDVKL